MSLISNPMAPEHRSNVSIKQGPIVYCFEAADNGGLSVREARITIDEQEPLGSLSAEHREDMLDGVTVVHGEGSVPSETWGPLYRPFAQRVLKTRPVELVGVPYYARNNRDVGEMAVWLQVSNIPKGSTERAAGVRAA